MKYALKVSFSIMLGAVLLAALHSHVSEHQVPHPNAAKVSAVKHVVPPPQLSVASVAVSVTASEHLIAIGLVGRPNALVLPETEQFYCRLRGPPPVCPLYVW